MPCPDELRLQARFDGEVDALAAAEIDRHLASCRSCIAFYESLGKLRDGLRAELPYDRAPARLRHQVLRAIDEEFGAGTTAPASRPLASNRWLTFWLGAASGVGLAAAAAFAFFLIGMPASSAIVKELVNDHIRSLMSTHLVDVVSTDRHTVKPWFAGRADVSPQVADFETLGYKLVGGRVDNVDHQRAAVLVYEHGPHVINVFIWSAPWGMPASKLTRNGYHMAFWQSGDLEYCAVSDTAWDELLGLRKLLQGIDEHEGQ